MVPLVAPALQRRLSAPIRAGARLLAFLVSIAVLGGCAALTPDRASVPPDVIEDVSVAGQDDLRRWGDAAPPNVDHLIGQIRTRLLARYARAGAPSEGLALNALALSGGAWDGAYGAGVLVGWSACGSRPRFDFVTGISTGALVAPFAFLGRDWDPLLTEAFTSPEVGEILSFAPMRALFGALGVARSTPLERLITHYATPKMLDAIGQAHRQGRRLYIGTTNLDAERPVIWDIGKLANSGLPNRLALFRSIVLASASVPGVFPPVFFDVLARGETYQEMHVDGGVLNSIFALPIQVDLSRLKNMGFPVSLRLYMLQNTKLGPDNRIVDLDLPSILAKTISALLRAQSRGDLIRLWIAADRHDADFRLGAIPDDFIAEVDPGFNTAYMTRLYDLGYRQGAGGYPWRTRPPGLEDAAEPEETAPSRCRAGGSAPRGARDRARARGAVPALTPASGG